MNNISITELKINPSKAIADAVDMPIAVENRNKVEAYLLGREIYENLVSFIENYIDRKAIENTDFSKGKDFEKVAKSLGV
jgi:PHD/YefM family antitoxin component YafN of YafNO toxin-antitoxin module